MTSILAVAGGGALGAVCRFLVGHALSETRFAYATLLVNAVGCFLLGLIIHQSLSGQGRLAALSHPGVTVGFLGALTTFSTFGYETVRFIEQGEWRFAAANVVSNVVIGLAAAWAGLSLARAMGWGIVDA